MDIAEFKTRIKEVVEAHKGFSVEFDQTEFELLVKFFRYKNFTNGVLSFPILKDGVIECASGVKRSCGTFLLNKKEIDLYEVFIEMFLRPPSKLFGNLSKLPLIQLAINGIRYKTTTITFRTIQRNIGFVLNKLPLVGMPYECWAMANRVMILDPKFDLLPPYDMLKYQSDLNKELFPWTSLGLSDSGMCNNALLKVDLRNTVPFAIRHHSPHRNLYQTLGMKGDELPLIITEAEQELFEKGIKRGGWNLMTAFIDLPENFEDQIIVNKRLKDLKVKEKRNFVSWGNVVAYEGEKVKYNWPLSVEPGGDIQRFNLQCENAFVSKIETRRTNSDGMPEEFKIIEITVERNFKDGFKLTNRHGNKGVIWLTETGYVNDPQRGKVPIDVIVSANSVKKRKNFGQLFEALCTLINKGTMIVENDKSANADKLAMNLEKFGYNKNGTCKVDTPWGEFNSVCGYVFWGVIKTPEEQVWHSADVNKVDNRGHRTSGIKISHIELKALTTIFGPNNPVIKEILDYQQGNDYLTELFCVCQSIIGKRLPSLPIEKCNNINTINQVKGFLHDQDELKNTIADIHPDGFILELPVHIEININSKLNTVMYSVSKSESEMFSENKIILNKIYIPSIVARSTWTHPSGKVGLEDFLANVNNLVRMSKEYIEDRGGTERILATFKSYINRVEDTLSTKTGKISDLGMAVRYPSSIKATAMLGSNLPKNTIQIHTKMAEDLNVKEGDFVLVERFPCLGFMSIRPQKIAITEDESSRFVIKVSGNSLNSLTLDFDGDVLFVMSFHTPAAKKAVENAFYNPNPKIQEAILEAENKKVPCINTMNLEEFGVERFMDLTSERNAEIVEGLTGIKRGTGTIVALCYNLMRIIERRIPYEDTEASIGMERLLDVVANSVFSRKHAGSSLEKECREAIATADLEKMVNLGLGQASSKKLCDIIKDEANKMGVKDLKKDFKNANKRNGSIIINRIIRRHHKIWFASRSNLPLPVLSRHLMAKPADLASHILKNYLRDQSKLKVLGV